MPRHFENLTGQEFGYWTVLRYSHQGKYGQHFWWCRCKCELEKAHSAGNLISGRTTMCRKCSFVVIGARNRKHGHTSKDKRPSKTYTAWSAAKGRTSSPTNKHWDLYGGRGIQMCERWRGSFVEFLSDMGDCPSDLSLERVDRNGNYSCGKCSECVSKGWPSNCTWDTQEVQVNNTRRCRDITFDGRTQTISQWAREKGLNAGTLHDRITYCKWEIGRALNTPTAVKHASRRERVGDVVDDFSI